MTSTTQPTAANPSSGELIKTHIRGQIGDLQRHYLHNQGGAGAAARAALAKLRRIDPLDPGGEPEAYSLIFDSLPETLMGRGDEPSSGEIAASAALYLFAIHQQGRSDATHIPGTRFAAAVRQLAYQRGTSGDLDDSVVTRFNHLCRASSDAMRITQLRSLVTLMRSARVGFDYGQLATDLFWIHRRPDDSRVYLRWARDFHRPVSDAPSPTSDPTPGA
ncbi:MAG: type I-E CRISPR-associated protein Cse2/CasB [Propioniciclava sp.]